MTKEELKQKLLNTTYFEDNEYLNKYIELLYNNRLPKHIKRYSQAHHAFPKSVSRKLGLEVDNSPENLFELEFSLHVLAHAYLSLCFSDKDLKRNNIIAYKWMSGGKLKNVLPSDIQQNDLQLIQKIYENDLILCGENHPMYGRKRPDVSKRNKDFPVRLMGERNGMYGKKGKLHPYYGKKHTEKEKLKMKMSWKYENHITESFIEKQKENFKIFVENKTGPLSKEAREKANKTKILNGTNKHSEKTKQKISNSKSIPVLCITTNKIYKNALEAEKETGLDRKLIAKNCRHEIEYVKYHKKQKSKQELNYIYDDTKYVFCYV